MENCWVTVPAGQEERLNNEQCGSTSIYSDPKLKDFSKMECGSVLNDDRQVQKKTVLEHYIDQHKQPNNKKDNLKAPQGRASANCGTRGGATIVIDTRVESTGNATQNARKFSFH